MTNDFNNGAEDQAIEANGIGLLRLAPFIPSDPVLWFSLIEANFQTAGITSDNKKFSLVANSLPPQQALEVRDVLVTPPVADKYAALKSELIKRLSTSQEAKTRRLLEQEQIGDRKPSQFLRHLRNLAGPAVPDAMIRTLWMGRLPRGMQMILATQTEQDLQKVADIADVIADSTTSPAPTIAAATDNALWISVQRQLEALQNQINAMSTERNRRSRSRSHSRNRSRSHSRSREDSSRMDWCWYHRTYGQKARKCPPPCTYVAEQSENTNGSH